MNYQRRTPKHGHDAHAQYEEDFFDNQDFFSNPRSRRADHKTHQLCRMVYKTATCSLAGDFGDPLIQNLVVEAVLPAPNASRLMICVSLPPGWINTPVWEVLRRLEIVQHALRREVAAAIVRKRAPELCFQVVQPGEVQS